MEDCCRGRWDINTFDHNAAVNTRATLEIIIWIIRALPYWFAAGIPSLIYDWVTHKQDKMSVQEAVGRLSFGPIALAVEILTLLLVTVVWVMGINIPTKKGLRKAEPQKVSIWTQPEIIEARKELEGDTR